MRQQYDSFASRNTEILVIGKASVEALAKFWQQEKFPFRALADPNGDVVSALGQQFRLLQFGRLPSVLIVDQNGVLQHTHHGDQANDIPDNEEIFQIIDSLDQPR